MFYTVLSTDDEFSVLGKAFSLIVYHRSPQELRSDGAGCQCVGRVPRRSLIFRRLGAPPCGRKKDRNEISKRPPAPDAEFVKPYYVRASTRKLNDRHAQSLLVSALGRDFVSQEIANTPSEHFFGPTVVLI